jgi:hypothetical protein
MAKSDHIVATPGLEENRRLVTDGPVEFEK